MNALAATTQSPALASYPARMRPAQVAAYFNCSETLVARLIQSGALPAVDVSAPGAKRQTFRVSREAVQSFEEARKS